MWSTGPPPLIEPCATRGEVNRPALLARIPEKSETIRGAEPESFLAITDNDKLDGIKTVMSPEPATRDESSRRPPASSSATIAPIAVETFTGPACVRTRTPPEADSHRTPRDAPT